MLQIINIISPLFIIIFMGAILRKFNYIQDYWVKSLNEFALKIGLPALIFFTLTKTTFSFQEEKGLFIVNSILILVIFGLTILINKILKLKQQTFFTLFICLVFGNVAYLGIPVISQVLGDKTFPKITLIIAVYFFWIFTLGIGYLDFQTKSSNLSIKNLIFNLFKKPLIIAIILGLIFSFLKIEIPIILLKPIKMLSDSVTPIILLVIGIFIGSSSLGKWSDWLPVFIFSFVILMIIPASFYFSLKLFGFLPKDFSVSIIESAMPLAITPFALADEYNLDKKFIANSIVLSTILSVVTLPFWICLVS